MIGALRDAQAMRDSECVVCTLQLSRLDELHIE